VYLKHKELLGACHGIGVKEKKKTVFLYGAGNSAQFS